MSMLGERVVMATTGRTLMVAEWGAPNGLPVFSLHGTPGSRLGRDPDPTLYERLDMHVVTYDRPGYGGSDRHHGRQVVDAVSDVVAIADALGFDRFVVGGGSGGPGTWHRLKHAPENWARVLEIARDRGPAQ